MASRMKEDERNEKIIRGLLRLPANRRCINCNSLGPQYVCTNFWTFICTNCSGIHREFTHRVKSVSMAKFTSQEVNALQEGGNERAKEIYFKEWDPQRHSFPDSSNVDRLRDFIRHVYVDRRYTGERNIDRPSRAKEESYENRKPDTYRGGSRSPSYDETYDRRYVDRPGSGGRNDDRNFRSSEERRSPGYDQSDYRRSPGQFDMVDERRRDDRYGNDNQNRRYEDRRFADGVPRPEGRPVINKKEPEISSPPMVRPVREILGEDAPPLRVGEPPRSNGTRVADVPAQTQRTTSSSSLASTESNPAELKRVNSGSLIDFDANPEHPVAAPPPPQPVPQPTNVSANGGDWASFDSVPQQRAQQAASNLSTLESALAELSAPVTPAGSSASTLSNPQVDLFSLTSDVGRGPVNQQNQPSLFQAAPSQSSVMHSAVPHFGHPSVAAPSSQPWASSLAPNAQLPLTTPSGQPSQTAVRSTTETNVGASPKAPVEMKPSGRMELPADLFTASYSSLPGWQTGPHFPMGYGLQYPTQVAMAPFPQPSKSMNPFDSSNEPTLVHATSFPAMASLQGALPNVSTPSPLMRTSSLGTSPSPRWVASQQLPYLSAVPPSGFVVQHAPSNISQLAPSNLMHPGHQHQGGFGGEGPAFGALGADQHLAARYSQPGTPNFPSVGGNPFG